MPLSLSSLTTVRKFSVHGRMSRSIRAPAAMPSVMLEVFPMMIDNIRVIIEQGPFSAEDAQYYIERIKATTKFTLKKVTFTRSDTYLDIRYAFAEIPFERIRRVALAAPPEKRAVNN